MSTKVKSVVRVKREEAQKRQAAYDALSLEAKLAKLDKVPGNSKRERERLSNLIAEKQKVTS